MTIENRSKKSVRSLAKISRNLPAFHAVERNVRSGPSSVGILILAAGQGKRMRSQLPKVLHSVGGQPILIHILKQVRDAAPEARVGIVVGHGREQVEAAVQTFLANGPSLHVEFIFQSEQRGTGHAARCAMEHPWGLALAESRGSVLVLPGDLPLLPKNLIEQMNSTTGRGDAVRLLTCELKDATGYGRIVRRGKAGAVLRIVEERDANPREKMIQEVRALCLPFSGSVLKVWYRASF